MRSATIPAPSASDHPPSDAPSFGRLHAVYRDEVDQALAAFLAAKRSQASASAAEAAQLVESLEELIASGGKRLRPALVHFTYLACGGRDAAVAEPVALATELLHAYLLVHDDIMDHAELRRGHPTVHAAFRARHRASGWRGDGADYGRSVAILVGDLAASFAAELFAAARLDDERRGELEGTFAAMCQEVIHGQHLELMASFLEAPEEEDLLRVLRLKSGRYSVERPIELGAILAGAPPETVAGLAGYGRALGEAFQLRDDLLGMFGETETVGKPVGGDLAEGKFTVLIHHALAAASPEQRAAIESARGNAALSPREAARVIEILVATGARDRVEGMIGERIATARSAFADLDLVEPGRTFLQGLLSYSRERRQ